MTPTASTRLVGGVLAGVVLVLALGASTSAQCAMCRTLLATPEGQRLASGFRHGILLLLVAPFLAFGAVAVLSLRARRRTSQMRDEGVEAEGPGSVKPAATTAM